MSSPPGAVSSPDLTAPGNLEILAHTAASQASDLHGAGENPSFAGNYSYIYYVCFVSFLACSD